MGKKRWSKIIEEHGVRVRLYERPGSDNIYREVRKPDGSKDRRSLGISDREAAEEAVRALCREVAEVRLTGRRPDDVTLDQLRRLYLRKRGPSLSDSRRRFVETALGYFVDHLGRDYPIIRFSDNTSREYVEARRSGTIQPDNWRAADTPSPGTIRNELDALSTVANWATREKNNEGRPLLSNNPVRGTWRPGYPRTERKRPRMTRERYDALLAVADKVDPEGRLRAMFVLAWETGRRVNAICNLTASDFLPDTDAIRAALADAGRSDDAADAWKYGAIRWRAEFDKKDRLTFSPLNQRAREALDRYLRQQPRLGDVPLFPRPTDDQRAMAKGTAVYWFRKAEKIADLAHVVRGGWHMFRRAWAHARKRMPVQDVMAAGGWFEPDALQDAYQSSDPEGMLDVVNG